MFIVLVESISQDRRVQDGDEDRIFRVLVKTSLKQSRMQLQISYLFDKAILHKKTNKIWKYTEKQKRSLNSYTHYTYLFIT